MTVAAFQELLAGRLGVPATSQELLAGFPTKPVQVCSTTLNCAGLPECSTVSNCKVIYVHQSCDSHPHVTHPLVMCAVPKHHNALQITSDPSTMRLSSLGNANGDTVVLRKLATKAPAAKPGAAGSDGAPAAAPRTVSALPASNGAATTGSSNAAPPVADNVSEVTFCHQTTPP